LSQLLSLLNGLIYLLQVPATIYELQRSFMGFRLNCQKSIKEKEGTNEVPIEDWARTESAAPVVGVRQTGGISEPIKP
jgi:hypothetical protein